MYVPRSGKVKKVIKPGEMEFMMHAVAETNAESLIKKCKVYSRIL